MTKTTISPRGQISIPKEIRDRLNLQPGTQVGVEVQGRSLVVKRLARDLGDWRTMRGMASGSGSLTEALMEERAADKAHDEARVKGR